jgi:hypothetical protein
MVLTPTGTIPIEKIKVGDEIIGWNTQSRSRVTTRVVKTFVHYNSPTLSLLTKNGWVGTTANHPFWNGNAWVEAGKLVPGSSYIYDDNGNKQLVIAAMKGADRTVYNLEVADATHDYFANSYLVHNKIMP